MCQLTDETIVALREQFVDPLYLVYPANQTTHNIFHIIIPQLSNCLFNICIMILRSTALIVLTDC